MKTHAQRVNARQDIIYELALRLNRKRDEKTIAERKWQAGLKPGKPQVACDHGLFSDEAAQLDLIEMFQEPVED
jgi:hypothetical protein